MDDLIGGRRVIYEQEGVFISIKGSDDETLSGGRLSIVERSYGVFIEWIQIADEACALDQAQEWDVITGSVNYKPGLDNEKVMYEKANKSPVRPICFELADVKSYKCSHSSNGWDHITFIQKDGTTHPQFDFHMGSVQDIINVIEKYVKIKRSSIEKNLWLLVNPNVDALEKSLNELQLFKDRKRNLRLVSRDPYTVAMGGFSKVTKFLYDYMWISDNNQLARPRAEMDDMLRESMSGIEIKQTDAGFELVTQKDLIQRPKIERGEALSKNEWLSCFNEDGQIVEVDQLLRKIFHGGVEHSIRNDVWKYLVGVYDYKSTVQSRQDLRKQMIDDYYRMKLQWKTMSVDQEKQFSDYRDRKSLIDKDVSRTDRTHPFFEGQNNENVQILYDILMTYCMYNFDLGYVQGMSDLLSPILIIMENEVDAFWTFVGFMKKVEQNFQMDQQGMKMQLHQLFDLLHFLDPRLCDYLESNESGNLYFCFRWLLILFKREFKFSDIMKLWEVLWTDLPCKHFHLLFCLAILDTEKDILMENNFGFTEILKHINDIAQHIKLEENLCKAEAIFKQLESCRYLPQNIQDVLGITVQSNDHQVEADGAEGDGADGGNCIPNHKSPQSNASSMETSSIELLYDFDTEKQYQLALDLNM